ncbi:MAG TPA: cyclase family protein [Dehalococcoidia bacterium]|nr:cyclase family protein [Dehalococcoidia bacterium]
MSLADRTPPSADEYLAYKERFSNWGRWGGDDQLGTLNHITEETRRAAAGLVSTGRTVSCSNPLAVTPGPRNANPAQHFMRLTDWSCTDYIGVSYHGFVNTHIDALCHIYTPDGQLYNGRPSSEITSNGARTNSIDEWSGGIVTRGVLYDIPRLRGTDHVTVDAPVHGWDLEDAAKAQGIEPRAGDAVLIRSGAAPFWDANPDFQFSFPPNSPGVHASVLEFLHGTDAALLGWDLQEAGGQDLPGRIVVHEVAIPYMGLPLLDNADYEELAEVCAELGRWEFQLVIAPLVVVGGTGSPANPIAIF